uniref:START domain-containing protein n=1 Tax=Globisporangium ultimum (strain ATCC 200006 / CBS 805.95 / DAOM BR144) TaxID=431595 RepID=K3WLU4_GLOUD
MLQAVMATIPPPPSSETARDSNAPLSATAHDGVPAPAATAPLLSDQELLDVLSQIDHDPMPPSQQQQKRIEVTSSVSADMGVPAAMGMSAAGSALADAWASMDMLEDNVFGTDDFADLMDTLSHSDETESTADSVSSPPGDQKKSTPSSAGAVNISSKLATSGAKPSRKRRKHELDNLRALATALEAKLASIKEANGTDQPGTKHFWKRISDQLLVEKQKAMGENARLREILKDQVKVVKSLQRSLAKSPDLNKLGVFPPDALNQSKESSKQIYGSMFNNIASSYDDMDTIFKQADVPDPTKDSRKVNMEMRTEGDRHVMCMQVVESKVLPFSFLFIGDAAWKYLSNANEEEQRTGFHREFKNQGDDIFGECKLDCTTGVVKLAGHVAMRRYIEKHRLTFVWECMGTCQNNPFSTKVVQMQEKGWCLFEPSEDDPLNSTIFRTCVHFTPKPMNEPQVITGSPIDVGLTTELVLGVYEKTVAYICNAVLSSLLEDLQAAK